MAHAAAALLFDGAGCVLLVREGYGARRYGLPGGVIEGQESPRATAVREVEEELGLVVEAQALIAVYHLQTSRGTGLRFFFRCTIVDGEPTLPDTGEVTEFVWATMDRLPSPMTESAPWAIADGLAGRLGVYRELDTRHDV